MQATFERAYQRLQGNHPRRPKSDFSLLAELACDVLFAASIITFVAGVVCAIWSFVGYFRPVLIAFGLLFMVLGPALLLVWDKITWKSFTETIEDLS